MTAELVYTDDRHKTGSKINKRHSDSKSSCGYDGAGEKAGGSGRFGGDMFY